MNAKKPYTAPKIFRVELNQEQAILSQCSSNTSSLANAGTLRCFPGFGTSFPPCRRASYTNFGNSGPAPS